MGPTLSLSLLRARDTHMLDKTHGLNNIERNCNWIEQNGKTLIIIRVNYIDGLFDLGKVKDLYNKQKKKVIGFEFVFSLR